MQLKKIPATVVTGFLGSGKTTLLSNIIKNANGKRIAIIVNEFGEVDVDADILRSCAIEGCDEKTPASNKIDNGVYELANGCICCTVEEEFLPVMKKLVERRDNIDHILIETSGLALPKPLVQAFNWPEIKQYCTVDAVITVVDGPAFADGRMAHDPDEVHAQRLADENLDHESSLHELLEDQLMSADLVIVSKNDMLNDAQRKQVEHTIRDHVSEKVKSIYVNHGTVASEVIMGLGFSSEDHINTIHTHHDHHHEHEEHHHHAHEDFSSAFVELGEVDGDKLLKSLQELIARETIYRVKGLVAIPNKPMRQVLQGVGSRIDQYFDRPWQAGEKRSTRLVFIGDELSKEKIRAHLQKSVA